MVTKIWMPLRQLKVHPFLANWVSGLIAISIIWLSLTPLAELPSVPGSDKTHHIIAYAALAIPTAFAYPKRLLVMAILYILLGGLIELIQPYVNRYGEWLDFMSNLSGVVLGSFIGLLLDKLVRN
jgi:VanZ family protein